MFISATKAAVRSFGRTLAAELAPRKIRVNTASPGPIATPIYAKLGFTADAAKQFEENMAQSVSLKSEAVRSAGGGRQGSVIPRLGRFLIRGRRRIVRR